MVREPLQKYKDAIKIFEEHAKKQYHLKSLERAGDFIKNYESSKDVCMMLDKEVDSVIKRNRERLIPIIKTIIFCGRNNLPLRGHREGGSLDSEDNKNILSGNQGVFRALLAFRIDSGDTTLMQHFQKCGNNSMMISGKIQNDLISSIGEEVRSVIVERIKKAYCFAVLLDETTDCSKKEQLTICVRYVDLQAFIIREEFLGFVEMKSTTAKAITDTLLQELTNMGLSLENLRGQGYDGAANMSGSFKGIT